MKAEGVVCDLRVGYGENELTAQGKGWGAFNDIFVNDPNKDGTLL